MVRVDNETKITNLSIEESLALVNFARNKD